MTFNAGEIKNEGVEIQLNGTPILNKDFSWDIRANFTKNWSELVSLPADVEEFYNSDTWLFRAAHLADDLDEVAPATPAQSFLFSARLPLFQMFLIQQVQTLERRDIFPKNQ